MEVLGRINATLSNVTKTGALVNAETFYHLE
jgi:hypothetical protein